MTNQSQQSMDGQEAREFAYDFASAKEYNSRLDDIEAGFLAGIQHERSRLAISKTDEEAFWDWIPKTSDEQEKLIFSDIWLAACAFKSEQHAADAELLINTKTD